jgi:hypothetical protein
MRALSPELARADLVSPVVAWLQQRWFWRGWILHRWELASLQHVQM